MSQLQTHVEPWEPNIPNPHEKVMTQLQITQYTMGTQDSHSKLEGNVTTTKHLGTMGTKDSQSKSEGNVTIRNTHGTIMNQLFPIHTRR